MNKHFGKTIVDTIKRFKDYIYNKALRFYANFNAPKKPPEVISFDNETGCFYLENADKYIHSDDIIKIKGWPHFSALGGSSNYGYITIVTKTDNYKFSCDDYYPVVMSILFIKYKYDLKNGKEDDKAYRQRYNWQRKEYDAEKDNQEINFSE